MSASETFSPLLAPSIDPADPAMQPAAAPPPAAPRPDVVRPEIVRPASVRPESVRPAAAPQAAATPPAASSERADLMRKAELEAAMLANPDDRKLRGTYFDLLFRLAMGHTGLLTANLPEVGWPLYFRTGTPDVAVLAQCFRDDAFAAEFKPTPLRILVIGAYAGFIPVDLARRHPRAHLLCAEPLADNFRLLSANTTPLRRVRVAQAAVWHSNARLAPLGRVHADWAIRLTDEAPDADRTVGALSVRDLLARAGWHHAEMIFCDACGAEREIFADPFSPWLRNLDVAMVRLYEGSSPGATANVKACFENELFEHRKQGEMDLFIRRTPRMSLPATVPPELRLIRNEPGIVPFQLRDVIGTGWAFFVFDGTNCQLHPNPPGKPPATAIFPVKLDGHTRLISGLQHAGGPGAAPVQFTVLVQRDDGAVLGRAEAKLAPHETGRLKLDLPGGSGPARVVLQTEMAAGAANNHMAWARWLDPTLT